MNKPPDHPDRGKRRVASAFAGSPLHEYSKRLPQAFSIPKRKKVRILAPANANRHNGSAVWAKLAGAARF
jgi:hypothetical protein